MLKKKRKCLMDWVRISDFWSSKNQLMGRWNYSLPHILKFIIQMDIEATKKLNINLE